MSNKSFRDVGPVIKFLRKKMVGRDLPIPLRFEPNYAKRTQPDPELPDGPSHRLFGNYYYSRDARRKVETPLQLVEPEELKKLADPGNQGAKLVSAPGGVKPGLVYNPECTSKNVIDRPKNK